MDKNVKSKHFKTDVAVLHDLSRFQAALFCLDLLNSLLNHPFPRFKIETCYSGRILWNLFSKFAEHGTIHDEIIA